MPCSVNRDKKREPEIFMNTRFHAALAAAALLLAGTAHADYLWLQKEPATGGDTTNTSAYFSIRAGETLALVGEKGPVP